jgi:PAS domain S-box-containing protein
LALLLSGWALSGVLFLLGQREQERVNAADFVQLTSNAQTAIRQRLDIYVDALRSGVGFLVASPTAGRREWDDFAHVMSLTEHYPGMHGFGVIYRVPMEETEKFLQRARADGRPDFAIHSVPGTTSVAGRDQYVITYVFPETGNQPAIGLDVATETLRREGADVSCDTGQPEMTSRITLVQDQKKRPGFLLYLPVYRKGAPVMTVPERRAALKAWVYVPFVIDEFMQGILGSRSKKLELCFFEHDHLDRDHLLFASTIGGVEPPAFERTTLLELAGQKFTLGWNRGPDLVSAGRSLLQVVAACLALSTVWFAGWLLRLQILRERAEAAVVERTANLRESEQSYRNQFAANSAVMLLIDPVDGAIIDANAAALRFYGYPRERLLALRITDISVLPVSEVRQALASISEEKGQRFEFQQRLANGSVREVEVSSSRIQFGARHVLHSIIIDVSERKRAEYARRESEQRLSYAMDATGEGIWDWNISTGQVKHNACWCRILGLDESFLEHPIAAFAATIHEPDRAGVMAAIQACLEGRVPYVNRHRMLHADGRIVWVLDRGRIVERDADGKPTRMVGSMADITEQERAEALQQEVLNRLQKIASRVPGLLYQYRLYPDGRSCFPFASDAIRTIYRVSPDEVRDDAALVFANLHPEDRANVAASIQESARDLTPWQYEYRVKFADGTIRSLFSNAVPEREEHH